METFHVICKWCGTRWTASNQPRRCENSECEAGWLDLPMFRDKVDADRVAEEYFGAIVAATREP